MRTVRLEKEVTDPSSLYFDLVERGFELISVSVHGGGTSVNLEDEEDKDPIPFMELFVGEPVKPLSRSVIEKRREIYRKFKEEKPLRMQNLKARFQVGREIMAIRPEEASASFSPAPTQELVSVLEERPIQVLALPTAKKVGILKRLRSLW